MLVLREDGMPYMRKLVLVLRKAGMPYMRKLVELPTCFEWAIAASCMAGTISEVFCTCLHARDARAPDSCQTRHSPARRKYIHDFLAGFADDAAGATHTCCLYGYVLYNYSITDIVPKSSPKPS